MADVRRLTFPVVDAWDWQLRAACRGLDSAVFFHPEGERGPSRAGREARAKRVCESCPVRRACLDHALVVQEPYGVWGGLSARERDALMRTRSTALAFPRRPRLPRRIGSAHAPVPGA